MEELGSGSISFEVFGLGALGVERTFVIAQIRVKAVSEEFSRYESPLVFAR